MSNVFDDLIKGAEELTRKAEAYMEGKEFLSNEEVMDRIWAAVLKRFERSGGKYDEEDNLIFENLNWDELPWWAAQTLDGFMPYASVPINGSLGFALGHSPASLDAHLRNIMEIAEGREQRELDFPVTFNRKEKV